MITSNLSYKLQQQDKERINKVYPVLDPLEMDYPNKEKAVDDI